MYIFGYYFLMYISLYDHLLLLLLLVVVVVVVIFNCFLVFTSSYIYTALNALALQLVTPGGMLFTFSCSSAVTQRGLLEDFLYDAAASIAQQQQQQQQRINNTNNTAIPSLTLTLLARRGPAAADHPVSFSLKEADYLSAILVRVDR